MVTKVHKDSEEQKEDQKKDETRKKGWRDIPIGGVIDKGGTAKEYNTGEWRTYIPVRDEKKCVHCMLCWAYCPDSAVQAEDGKVVGFDTAHCKGCGICASICPVKCIKMEKEEKD